MNQTFKMYLYLVIWAPRQEFYLGRGKEEFLSFVVMCTGGGSKGEGKKTVAAGILGKGVRDS